MKQQVYLVGMPLRQHITNPNDPDWVTAECPACGADCWDRPKFDKDLMHLPYVKVCTLCMLRSTDTLAKLKLV